MSKIFGRLMVESGAGGSIVNISSIAGKKLSPNTAAYAASKAGLQALSACMAQEVAEARVRVNTVCPGLIDTSRMDDLGRGEVWDNVIKQLVPLGRPGTGEDIAHIVVYLCSDEGSWVTGQAWNVDGGTVVQH
jgi:NAD(P)-dependent dehydrogenase (short-subunit alcohol dehydrogenase family)